MQTFYILDPDVGGAYFDTATDTWQLDWTEAQQIEAKDLRAAVSEALDELLDVGLDRGVAAPLAQRIPHAEETAQGGGDFTATIFVATDPAGSDAKPYTYEVRVRWTYNLSEASHLHTTNEAPSED